MDTMLSKALREFTTGPLNQLFVNLSGKDGQVWDTEFKKFLRKEPCWTNEKQKWHEEDGVIYFRVTSDGTTGEDWITRLESKGFRVSDYAKQVLRSPDFKPTSGVTTEVAVLKDMFFTDNDRITKKIRAEADKRKLQKPNAEQACLINEKFTDKEIEAMGLWYIVAMHEPVSASGGGPGFLRVSRINDGRWLYADYDRPNYSWCRGYGFAFAVPTTQG